MTERADVGELKLPSTGFWRSLFKLDEVTLPHADPLHCDAPVLRHAEIAAVYSGQRVAGDFYEFLRVGPSRMLFVLLDIAGLRADTREILIAVQKTFRTLAPELTICVAVFAFVRHSSVAITKIWGRCAVPMRAIRRGCFAITRGSRRSKPTGCPLACSRTRCRAQLAVTLCPARLFWLSHAESSKQIMSTRITRLRNSDWTG